MDVKWNFVFFFIFYFCVRFFRGRFFFFVAKLKQKEEYHESRRTESGFAFLCQTERRNEKKKMVFDFSEGGSGRLMYNAVGIVNI